VADRPTEPTTQYFAGLLDLLAAADPADRPALEEQLVAAAYRRARRLTQAIIRGDMGLPPAVETDDILQETMHDFSRQVADVARTPACPDALFALLCAIIRARAVDEVRRRLGRQYQTQFPTARLAPGDDVAARADLERIELRLTVNELVAGLPPADRELIDLRYIEEWSLPQIAAHRGTTVETVRWAVGRVLRTLQETAEGRQGRNPPPDSPPALDP
jgi:RNA polymerase sigma factor (sigma-70 family)